MTVEEQATRKRSPFAVPKPGRSVADLHPELAAQWDHERNERTSADYTARSNYRAHWVCGNGADHRWQATIGSRTDGFRLPFR